MSMKSTVFLVLISIYALSCSLQAQAMQVLHFQAPDSIVGQYNKYEVKFNLNTVFDNPFDPAEIDIQAVFIDSKEKMNRIFAFYTQDFELKETDVPVTRAGGDQVIWNLREYLPISEGYWMVRFAPTRIGEYKYYLEINGKGESIRYPEEGFLKFKCIASGNHGFLNPDPRNDHYLRFDDGTPYFGVGLNATNTMGDCDQGKVLCIEVMTKLAEYGANICHIDLCQGDNLEWTKQQRRGFPYYQAYEGLGRYNLQTAWGTDRAIEAAERFGMYLRLTLLHWVDFFNDPPDGSPDSERYKYYFVKNPYFKLNGGPCSRPIDFFSNETAWKYQEQLFRYIVARWGYSANILCWEFWNEVDGVPEYNLRVVGSWHQKAKDLLHQLDPNHMVTTSFIGSGRGVALFENVDFDLVTFHQYSGWNRERPFNTVDNLLEEYENHRVFGKPIIPGEFGSISTDGFGPSLGMKEDVNGLHLHNQLWSSLFIGMAATAMHWHWELYIDKYNLYHHCEGIVNFLRGEDLSAMKYYGREKVKVECGRKEIKIPKVELPTPEEKAAGVRARHYFADVEVPEALALALVSPKRALVWVHDQGNVATSNNPTIPLSGVKITVKGLDNGSVVIEYWDTTIGTIISQEESTVSSGILVVTLPPFSGDLAMKIYRK